MELALYSLPRFDLDMKASLSMPSVNENFNVQSGKLKDPDLQKKIQQAATKLI